MRRYATEPRAIEHASYVAALIETVFYEEVTAVNEVAWSPADDGP